MRYATLALALALASVAHADTWDVSASCNPQFYQQLPVCATPANMSAVFTTTLETGYFYNPASDTSFYGQAPVVTGISGTMDGMAMTLIPSNGWMQGELPEDVEFTAGANTWLLFFDGYYYLQAIPWEAPWTDIEYLDWSAVDPVDTPEPNALILTLTGILFALIGYRYKRRRCNS